MKRSRQAVRAGFTLVELAVVISLIATLATLAYPSLADWMAKKRVAAAAEALHGDLIDARLMAAQRGKTLHVSFAEGGGADACWALALAAACDCRVAQSCRLQTRRLSEHRGVTLIAAAPAHFSAEGLGVGSAELRSARGHLLRVQVSRLGRASICAPAGADARYPAC